MTDPRIEKLAQLLVNYCIRVKPGDRVALNSSSAAIPLVNETLRAIIRAGGMPYVIWNEESFTEILLKEGNDDQLRHISEPEEIIFRSYDSLIRIGAAVNTRALSGVDSKRQKMRQTASRELLELLMKRSAAAEMDWVGTLYPTNAQAQEADMSLSEFEAFVYGACYVDREDPVAEWQKLSKMQQTLVDWLKGRENVRVTGPNADLTLSIAGRTFINSDGRRNMPSGEIFTGPVEASANGWIRFSYPAIYSGREVDAVELCFENGRVVEASAKKNESFLLDTLDTDEGARFLGEFAIGTNKGINRFSKSILFDEKIGGTIHLAVGAGYPETGSSNRSAVHWDMICDMRNAGRIWIDDELFYDSGEFQILNH